jgi:hypothetical protein
MVRGSRCGPTSLMINARVEHAKIAFAISRLGHDRCDRTRLAPRLCPNLPADQERYEFTESCLNELDALVEADLRDLTISPGGGLGLAGLIVGTFATLGATFDGRCRCRARRNRH